MMRYLIILTTWFLCSLTFSLMAQANDRLRAGDIIMISMPGEAAFDAPFSITREGRVILPEIGSVDVVNKTLPDASAAIRTALGKVYRDTERVTVTLKEQRLVVSVLGYVKNPGPVNLVKDATIQMAISAAGGLRQGAQLDKLQIRRGDLVTPFDYKNYLDTGDASAIPVLQPLDVIFVPASPLTGKIQVDFDPRDLHRVGDAGDEGQSVKVFGEVHRPGSFSYKDGNSIVDLLMRAGGVTRYAGVEQIRVISGSTPRPFNMREYLDTGRQDLLVAIGPGDTIYVPQAQEGVKSGVRTVYVMGEVFKPGAFELTGETSFMDLLANAGGPNRYAETRHIRLLKQNGQVVKFDMQAYTEGLSQKALPDIAAGDAIFVPEKTDMNEKSWLKIAPDHAIRIIGAVNRPGRYEWSDEMNILDLIAHAGGPRAAADASHVQVLPPASNDPAANTAPVTFDFQKFVDEGGRLDDIPAIGAGYTVVVPELPKDPNDNRSHWVRLAAERSIYIMGAVGAPGRYAFNPELSFLDILAAANGPKADADLGNLRISHRKGTTNRVTKFDLSLYFETGDEALLPDVKPEDVIYVPSRDAVWTQRKKENTIRVLGEVARPGRYSFNDTMTILDLLAEAGGPTSNALQSRIIVANQSLGAPVSQSFDLIAFAKSGDFHNLPVLRTGDTVYVPHQSESPKNKAREFLRDAVSLLTILTLAL